MYHYQLCGLPNIFLVNGYKKHETFQGEGISIDRVDELHKAIAMAIIQSPTDMTGAEFRFLRKEMNLSQKGLARLMGVEDLAVTQWEKKEPTPIASRMMQVIARSHYTDSGFKNFIERLAELDRREHEALYFEEADSGWLKVMSTA